MNLYFFVSNSDPAVELKSLPASLIKRAEELTLENEDNLEGYSLGNAIHVKGKIKIFRDFKEIVALYHGILFGNHICIEYRFLDYRFIDNKIPVHGFWPSTLLFRLITSVN